MKYYKLRIDSIDPDVISHIANHYSPDCYLFAVEGLTETNPHTHFYLEMEGKPTALRAYIRKHVGAGNGIYSLVELDECKPVEYLAYCIKGGDHQSRNIDLDPAKSYDFKIKDDRSKKKKERKTVLQSIIEHYQFDTVPFSDRSTIIDQVILYHKEKGVLIREFAMISIVQTLLLRYDPTYSTTISYNIHKAIDKSRC